LKNTVGGLFYLLKVLQNTGKWKPSFSTELAIFLLEASSQSPSTDTFFNTVLKSFITAYSS